MSFDVLVFRFINGLANYFWIIDWFGVFFAKYLPIIAVVLFFLIWLQDKNLNNRLKFFFVTILSVLLSRGIITEIIRFIYNRPRPPAVLSDVNVLLNHDVSRAFPSGHAAFFFALALSVFYFNRRWGIIFFTMATLIGLGRIFVGIHWPLDIVSGALVGLASAFMIKKLLH